MNFMVINEVDYSLNKLNEATVEMISEITMQFILSIIYSL